MTALVLPNAASLSTPERQRILVAQAREWLAEARDITNVDQLRASAATLETYAKTIKASAEAITAATEIRLRAERRIGELLAEEPKHSGGRPETPKAVQGVSPTPPTVAGRGLTYNESSAYQRLAAVPTADFEEAIDNGRKDGSLSRSGVLRKVQAEAPPSPPEVWLDGDRFMAACERLATMAGAAATSIRFGHYPGDGPDLIADRPARALTAARQAIAAVEAELRRKQ